MTTTHQLDRFVPGHVLARFERGKRSVTVVEGHAAIRVDGCRLDVSRGRSAVVPAALEGVELELRSAHVVAACVAVPGDRG